MLIVIKCIVLYIYIYIFSWLEEGIGAELLKNPAEKMLANSERMESDSSHNLNNWTFLSPANFPLGDTGHLVSLLITHIAAYALHLNDLTYNWTLTTIGWLYAKR